MTAVPLEIVPQDPEGHLWDAVVVGAGAGGSAAGFNLARLGRSVLFVERGRLLHHDPTVAKGVPFSWIDNPQEALRHGWWPRPLYYQEDEGELFGPYEAGDWLWRRRIDRALQRGHGQVSSRGLYATPFLSGCFQLIAARSLAGQL